MRRGVGRGSCGTRCSSGVVCPRAPSAARWARGWRGRCRGAASACPTRTSPTPPPARDPRRLALAALVRCVEDERCSASFPHAFPAVLRVTTRTGEELQARVEVNRGGPGNPLSGEELVRKFHGHAVRALPEERAAELAARTLALPDAQSVEDLTALLASAGERLGRGSCPPPAA